MHSFVTGATGFIGGHLVRRLLARGHSVTALVRTPGKAGDLARAGVRLHRGDILDRESMREGMAGADAVFHLAAWYEVGAPDSSPAERVNVKGTRHVLDLARELGIPRAVYTSSLAVNSDTHGEVRDETYRHPGPWLTAYDRSKWRAHYLVAEPMIAEGLPLTIVMPGVVYGPGDPSAMGRTLRQFLTRSLPVVPRRTAFSWAHVEDIAEAHLLALERGRPGETYIIAGPGHTLEEALGMAGRLTGIPGPRLHAPPWVLRTAAALARPLERVLPLPPTYRSETLRTAAGVTYLGDNAKARRELGYEPRPLETGLAQTLAAEMERLGIAPARPAG